jgi:aryl-alcohol dehydrogenase-like predicted oxidoreductase
MKYRKLGRTGMEVSEIGHGTWAMGSMWGSRDDGAALSTLLQGFQSGINFVDTAYGYGKGHAERLIARALKNFDGRVFVATKCPPKLKIWPPKAHTPVQELFPREHIVDMTEASLKNLETDCLDLQQLHIWRDEWLEQGDWLEAVEKLKSQGKIRCFGVSLMDHAPDSALKLVNSGLVDTIQVIFNLFDQSPRKNIFPLCLKKNVGVIVRVALDEGGLSGSLSPETKFPKGDWRVHYFSGERLKETCDRAGQFGFLIRDPVRTLAQAALKFSLSEEAVSSVVVGMRSISHLKDNVAVSELEDFSPQELEHAYALAWPRNYYPVLE